MKTFRNFQAPPSDKPYRCPCCRYPTLPNRGGFAFCPVCGWEDDGQDDHDIDEVRGGPNGSVSLREGQRNFEQCGACLPHRARSVRAATAEEKVGRWPFLEEIEAAARSLDADGRFHSWWPETTPAYGELDLIGKEEFEATVERVLMAARRAKRP